MNKVYIAILGLGFVINLAGCLMLKQQQVQLNKLREEEIGLRVKINHLQTKIKQEALNMKSAMLLHSQLQKQRFAVVGLPKLLETIAKAAQKAGLRQLSFTPRTQKVHRIYTELPVRIRLQGQYVQLMTFLRQLAHLPFLLNIHAFKLLRLNTNPQTLSFECEATIYGVNHA